MQLGIQSETNNTEAIPHHPREHQCISSLDSQGGMFCSIVLPERVQGSFPSFLTVPPLKKDTFASRFWMTKWHCRMRKWILWHFAGTLPIRIPIPIFLSVALVSSDSTIATWFQLASSAPRGSNIVVKTFSNHLQPSTPPSKKTLMPLSCPLSR